MSLAESLPIHLPSFAFDPAVTLLTISRQASSIPFTTLGRT